MLSEELNMSKTVYHEILTEDLGNRILNVILVTCILHEELTADRSAICADLWTLKARMIFCCSIIAGDKTRRYKDKA
jgi:hypothetical protein